MPRVAAPFAGAIADRLRPARLLAGGLLAQAALAGSLALRLPSLGPLLAIVFLLALVDTPLGAAVGRCIPVVVADGDLVAAKALRSGMRELGTVLGPPLAGLIFAASGARLVPGLDALTFLLAAPLVLGLPEPEPGLPEPGVVPGPQPAARPGWARRFLGDVREGLATVVRLPSLLAIAAGFWIVVFFSAPDDLILPFLATTTFRSGPVTVGVLLAAASAGLLTGCRWSGPWGDGSARPRRSWPVSPSWPPATS